MAERVIFPASVCLSEVKQNARSILENQRLTLCIPGKNYLMHQDSDENFKPQKLVLLENGNVCTRNQNKL